MEVFFKSDSGELTLPIKKNNFVFQWFHYYTLVWVIVSFPHLCIHFYMRFNSFLFVSITQAWTGHTDGLFLCTYGQICVVALQLLDSTSLLSCSMPRLKKRLSAFVTNDDQNIVDTTVTLLVSLVGQGSKFVICLKCKQG